LHAVVVDAEGIFPADVFKYEDIAVHAAEYVKIHIPDIIPVGFGKYNLLRLYMGAQAYKKE
jgi:hypothetical protein